MHFCIGHGPWWVHSALIRALSVARSPFERHLNSTYPSKRAADSQNFWCLSNTDGAAYLQRRAISPALRSRSSEGEKKLSNRPAASSFFQTFRTVDLKSPTDLSAIPTDLTDLWADL